MVYTLWVRLLHQQLGRVSAAVLVVITVMSILAPLVAPNDPYRIVLEQKLAAPSIQFPLGTDHLGRCLLSRLMYGARISLSIACIVMVITMAISITIGTYAGYRGGVVDHLIMRLCDIVLAFPSLVLILAIVGMLGPSLGNAMLALVAVQWAWYARIIRGMTLSLRERNFVLAARISGTRGSLIIWKHILPNTIPHIAILASLDMGWVILHISGLSFLGLGVQPPTPEWGAMLNDGRPFFRSHPALMIYPGLMILLVVLAFNLLGDALRDALDPTESKFLKIP